MSEETTTHIQAQPEDKAKTRHILKVALYLFLITVAEFAIAFTMPAGILRTSIFLIMTVVKAFYIVAEFMHLKHETKVLAWSIIIPLVFVVWLVIALMAEGSAIYNIRF